MNRSVLLGLVAAGLVTFPAQAQTPSPAEVAAAARQQQADVAFAAAERELTVRLLDKSLSQLQSDATQLAATRKASDALTARLAALRTSDEGKRLAAGLDVICARQVQRLLDEPTVSPEALASIEKQLASARESLTKLRQDPPSGFVPSDAQQDELTRIAVTLRTYNARLKERQTWLEDLILACRKDVDVSKAPTLEAALADFRRRQRQAWNDAQRLGIEQAQPEGTEQIREAARAAELERALEQARQIITETRDELERLRLESKMRLDEMHEEQRQREDALKAKLAEAQAARYVKEAQNDTKVQQGQQDAEKIRLSQRCRDPQVQKLLAPFLAHGMWQPGDRKGNPQVRERGPMSFSGIQATGALQPTPDGLKALLYLGNATVKSSIHKNPDTERPHWGFSFSAKRLSESDWDQIRKAQSLLNELGPTFVELKLLAP
jgi:hypothetical protein